MARRVTQKPRFHSQNGLHSGLRFALKKPATPTLYPCGARKTWRVLYIIDLRGEKKNRKARPHERPLDDVYGALSGSSGTCAADIAGFVGISGGWLTVRLRW